MSTCVFFPCFFLSLLFFPFILVYFFLSIWNHFMLSIQAIPVKCFPQVRHFWMRDLWASQAFPITQGSQGILILVLSEIVDLISIVQVFPPPFVFFTQIPYPFLFLHLTLHLYPVFIYFSLCIFFLAPSKLCLMLSKFFSYFWELGLHVCHPWLFPQYSRLCNILILSWHWCS